MNHHLPNLQIEWCRNATQRAKHELDKVVLSSKENNKGAHYIWRTKHSRKFSASTVRALTHTIFTMVDILFNGCILSNNKEFKSACRKIISVDALFSCESRTRDLHEELRTRPFAKMDLAQIVFDTICLFNWIEAIEKIKQGTVEGESVMSIIYCTDNSDKGIEYDDLESTLERLTTEFEEDLWEAEWDFVFKLQGNFAKYGARVFISSKQLDWLKQIFERVSQ